MVVVGERRGTVVREGSSYFVYERVNRMLVSVFLFLRAGIFLVLLTYYFFYFPFFQVALSSMYTLTIRAASYTAGK